jgi:hypothetical protein
VKNRESPELNTLLGGWFHEDWTQEALSWEGVVDAYVAAEGPGVALRSYDQLIGTLRRARSDEELDRFLTSRGCAYSPDGFGQTAREWLEEVAVRLREGVT